MDSPPRRFGLRTRLVALVLAPAIVLALFGGAIALRERNSALKLSRVRDEAGVLSDLTKLRGELLEARAPVEISVRSVALKIPKEQAFELLGLEPFGSDDIEGVARILRRLPPDARPFEEGRLQRLVSATGADVGLEAVDQFDTLDTLARDTWDRRFQALRAEAAQTGSTELDLRLDDLEAATQAGSAAGTMVTKLADYWFSFLGDGTRAAPARSELAVASRQFDRAIARLQSSEDLAVLRLAFRLGTDLPKTDFAKGVEDAVDGLPPAPFVNGVDVPLVAKTFSTSFDLFAPLYDLMTGRSTILQITADSLAADATRTAVITLSAIIIVTVVMVGISLSVAATFERPLSRLIEATRRVGGGDLTVEPLATDGPAEIGEASAAFNDVVANLRLLEGKVDALANADLSDPRLEAPLPGELGDTMDRSIQLLEDSLADRQRLEERLAFQATHDALTALPNRLGALEALEGALARAQRTGNRLAVAFLDLDGFKEVNDTYGHQTGDAVLQEVARRLDQQARTGDYCARLGGDEFVIVAENVASEHGAVVLGRRVADAIGEPMRISGRTITVGASIGIAFRQDDEEAMHLLARADSAAYRAKRDRSVVVLS